MENVIDNNVIAMLNSYAEQQLKENYDYMLGGKYFSDHDNSDKCCDAIVMFASGDICPIFRNRETYPHAIYRQFLKDTIIIGTLPHALNEIKIVPNPEGILETIRDYNELLCKHGCAMEQKFAIIGYHVLRKW